jgi:hypothetical protein
MHTASVESPFLNIQTTDITDLMSVLVVYNETICHFMMNWVTAPSNDWQYCWEIKDNTLLHGGHEYMYRYWDHYVKVLKGIR